MGFAGTSTTALGAAGDGRFKAVFEHAPIGMAIIGLEGAYHGVCLTVNPLFAAMLAMPIDEMSGVPLSDFIHAADHDAWGLAIDRLGAPDGTTIKVRVRFRARGAGHQAVVCQATAVTGDRGSWRCAIVQALPE